MAGRGTEAAAEREAFSRTRERQAGALGIDYPNREHQNADRAARRHAATALAELESMTHGLARRLDTGSLDFEANDADRLAEQAGKARAAFAEIAILRDVREWHAADLADAQDAMADLPAGPVMDIVRSLASMRTDSTNPTSQITGLVEAARELVPESEREE
jgi:hypothetical protein